MTALLTPINPEYNREQLILDYYPLVRTIACRMARRLPPSVEVDELINIGTLGLIDAVDRYDASRGVPFKAYAEIRIQGSMFDSLRGDDWVPRSVRRKVNRIEHAKKSLTFSLGRDPSREEMATAMDLSVEEYDKLMENVKSYLKVSGNAQWEMLVFDHNKHQVDQCRQLAMAMGFAWFRTKEEGHRRWQPTAQ